MIFLRVIILTLIFGGIHVYAKANLTVAADGSGDVKTVTEAVEKVPENNRTRFVIFIKKGVYNEQVRIPSNKPYISFIGESAETTRIAYDISNKRAGTTSAAYAVYIGGHDFRAENITFENSFDFAARKSEGGTQAVAVLSEADRLVFKNCRFLGWQDTLYAKNGRQYFENCYIEGHVDFIFAQGDGGFLQLHDSFEGGRLHRRADAFCGGRAERVCLYRFEINGCGNRQGRLFSASVACLRSNGFPEHRDGRAHSRRRLE